MPPPFQYEQIEKEDSMGKIEQGLFGERYRITSIEVGYCSLELIRSQAVEKSRWHFSGRGFNNLWCRYLC